MNRKTRNRRARLSWAAALLVMGLAISPREALAQLGLGSLVVTVTSPSSGSTVSGTVTAEASVTIIGFLTVQSVEFRLDGARLGTDASAPYSIPWNTTTTSNGSHTLTAVARDLLGVQWTSDPVTVTVSNTDTTTPTVSISSPESGATVSGTIAVDATASDDRGVGGVQFHLDGAPLGAEDTSAPYSVPWDTTTVADGSHSLTARARDEAGNTATSTPVEVAVSNGAPGEVTRFEDTDSSIAYTAGWTEGDRSRAWSGGTAAVSATGGAQATFTFTGTEVRWIGFRGPQAGIARVFLDGTLVEEVDTYAATEEVQATVFTLTDLATGSHTLTIEVTGLKNPDSTNTFIVVDAFDVTSNEGPGGGGTATRLEEDDPAIEYDPSTEWFPRHNALYSGGKLQASPYAVRATLTFTGTSVSWIGVKCDHCGIARVHLDGALAAEVDTFSPALIAQEALYTAAGLSAGTHTLTIEVTGTWSSLSGGAWVGVDAFDVTP